MLFRSEVLEARRDAVLCCTDAKLIDERGHETSTFRNVETLGLDDRRRVQSFLRSSARCIAFYGLFRRDALLKTKLLRRLWAPDWCMLFELSFEGGFARIPENLLIYRAWGAKGKMDRSSIRSTYYSADTKIPPYPWTAIFLYSDTWAELFRISFSKGNGWIKRLELSWDVFRLYAVHWYQGICLEYYRRLYWYNESKDRGRTVVAAFFCFLFKPWCVFQYDFCCILLHAIMGEKMWVFCRKMKSSLGGEK